MCISSFSIMVSPDQQSFLPISDESDSMVDLSDALGSEPFRVTVNVRNTGPSNSRFATLMIYWPFMDPDETDQFFLYPTRITTVSYEVIYGYMYVIFVCIYTYRVQMLHVVWSILTP